MEYQVKRSQRRISPRREIREVARIRRGFERSLESRLARFFISLTEQAADEFVRRGNIGVTQGLIMNQVNQILVPFYRDVMNTFGERVLRNLGLKTEFDDVIRFYMLKSGGERIQAVSTTTRQQIMQVILKGNEEGVSEREIGKRIRDKGMQMSRGRARTIARTEVHSASTFANHELASRYMPTGTVKQWVSTNDGRTRPNHRAMNGQQVPLEDDFVVFTNGIPVPMAYCGDPRGGVANVVNCRCQTIYVETEAEVEKEPVSMSEEPWMYKEKVKGRFDLDEMDNTLRTSFFQADLDRPDIGPAWEEIGKKVGMSEDEFKAIVGYTGSSYNPINKTLRDWFYEGADTVSSNQIDLLVGFHKTLASGLRKLPAYKGTSVRGISVGDVREFVRTNGIKKGATYRTESVFSTTKGGMVDPTFDGNVTFLIKGKNGRYIEDMSINKGEREVLFPAGHEFEVTYYDIDEDGNLVIEMTDIGDDVKADPETEEVAVITARMREKMQSQAPLASVDNVLMNPE